MIEFRPLNLDDLEAWIDHCTGVFFHGSQEPAHRRYFEHAWKYDPQHDLNTILVAIDGKRILSAVQVRKTMMYLCGQGVPMGGIANVATLPEARKQGLSTRLLQEAIRLMEVMKIPVSLLQTGIPLHYSRLGWECVPLSCKKLQVDRSKRAGFEVLPLNFVSPSGDPANADDVVVSSLLHAAFASRFNGPLMRCREDWRKFSVQPSSRWWAAKIEARLVAYLCLESRENSVVVIEYGALAVDEYLFDPFLAQVLDSMNFSVETVTCPGIIPTHNQIIGWDVQTHWMARLNQPISVSGLTLETTDDLVNLLRGPERGSSDSQFTYFENDGF